jgi:hypothetical protein
MYDKTMTADERRIANAALGAGSRVNHDQLVIGVAAGLKRDPQTVEAVLQKLRIRLVLSCIGTSRDVNVNPEYQKPSVRYEKGMDWTEE